MNVIDYNIKKMKNGFELKVRASSPSPHWTHIGLCVINQKKAPRNGTLEIILEGTPPNNDYQMTNLQEHHISVFIVHKPWLKAINVRNSLGDVLKNINVNFSPIKTHNLNKKMPPNTEDYAYNELYFANPNVKRSNTLKVIAQ